MKRKIVQHGSSTLTVSLPYKWAKRYNLNKGDEIDLVEQGKTLVLKTEHSKKDKEINLKIKDRKHFFKRDLINLYRKGYDEVKLDFDSELPLDDIIEKIDELLGYEIVHQSDNSCTIRNVTKVDADEFDMIFRRLFITTLNMSENCLKYLKIREYTQLKRYASLEKENNKLANFCQRILNKSGFDEIDKTTSLYSVINYLEQIGDSVGELAEYIQENNLKVGNGSLTFFLEINKYFREIYNSFFAVKKDKITELTSARKKLYANFFVVFNKSDKKEGIVLAYLKQILENLHHLEISIN